MFFGNAKMFIVKSLWFYQEFICTANTSRAGASVSADGGTLVLAPAAMAFSKPKELKGEIVILSSDMHAFPSVWIRVAFNLVS